MHIIFLPWMMKRIAKNGGNLTACWSNCGPHIQFAQSSHSWSKGRGFIWEILHHICCQNSQVGVLSTWLGSNQLRPAEQLHNSSETTPITLCFGSRFLGFWFELRNQFASDLNIILCKPTKRPMSHKKFWGMLTTTRVVQNTVDLPPKYYIQ